MATSRFARYLSDSCRSTEVAAGLVMANTNCGEISPPRENAHREFVPAPADKFSRKNFDAAKNWKSESHTLAHIRGSVEKWREREVNTHARTQHTHTHTHTHIYIYMCVRSEHPKENNTHRSFYPRVYFSEDFSPEDCFQGIIPKDRSSFFIQIASRYLGDSLS